MAIYHFHVTQISRGKGQTAVSAAAYRAGEKLHDNYYGEEPDYTKKGGVLYTEIILPEHAPKDYADRETLWNAVELAEANDLPKGVYVKSVLMDSPAMIGGIQSGDVIVKINGENVSTEDAYQRMVLSLEPDKTYKIVLKRQGADGYTEVSCEVTAGILQ